MEEHRHSAYDEVARLRADLEPDLDEREAAELLALAQRLRQECPVPSALFRGRLQGELRASAVARPTAGSRTWEAIRARVLGFGGGGVLLLVVAAIAGPLG